MPFARNIELVGYHDLAGRSGFKLAMTEREGRFFLYVAALWEPGWSIVDVTDPTRAELVRWIPGPEGTWTIQVQVAGERMVTSLERIPAGWGNSPAGAAAEGFYVWDIADPTTPRLLGHWKSGAVGTHRNYYDGGRYVHAATTLPGFAEHVYGIVDIDDPEHPVLVGRWWWPGQHVAAGEQLTEPEIAIRASGRPYRFGDGSLHPAVSLHGGAYVAGERAYCPWMRQAS